MSGKRGGETVKRVKSGVRKGLIGAVALVLILGSGGCPAAQGEAVRPPEIQWLPYSGKLQTYQVAEGYFGLTLDYDSSRGFERNTTGLLDETGKVILPFEYNFISSVSEGIAAVSKMVSEDWGQSGNTYYAYVDLNGKQLTPFEYAYAGPMLDGAAVVNKWINSPDGSGAGQKYSLVNREGKEIIPFIYDWILDPTEGRYPAQQNGKWGFIDRTGTVTIPIQYEKAGKFSGGLAPVKLDGKWGYVDLEGVMKIAPEYENAFEFSEGLAFVVKGGQGGFIDTAGTVVIPFQFDPTEERVGSDFGDFSHEAQAFFHEDRAVVSKDGKRGLIDRQGNAVTEFRYERMGPCWEGRVSALDGSAWGVLDDSGKVVIPFEYMEIGNYQDGLVPVGQRRNYSGLFDRAGRQVYPFSWNGVRYSNGLGIYGKDAEGQEGTRYGAANSRGDVVIPFQYDNLWPLSDRSLLVWDEETDGNGNLDVVRVGIMSRPDSQALENTEKQVRVILDGELLSFDQDPIIESGRTLVPMRTIFTKLGANVDWDQKTKTVSSHRSDVEITLTIGEKQATVNGETVALDVPAQVRNGRTLVPLRFVAEAMDADVNWDQEELEVAIHKHTAADHFAAIRSASLSAIRADMTSAQIEALLGTPQISRDREAKEGNGPGTLTYFVDGAYPFTLGTFASETAVIGKDGAAVREDFLRVKQSLAGVAEALNRERGPLWSAEPADVYRYWDLGTIRGMAVFGVRLRDVDYRGFDPVTAKGVVFPEWSEDSPCFEELYLISDGVAVRLSQGDSAGENSLTVDELMQLANQLKGR